MVPYTISIDVLSLAAADAVVRVTLAAEGSSAAAGILRMRCGLDNRGVDDWHHSVSSHTCAGDDFIDVHLLIKDLCVDPVRLAPGESPTQQEVCAMERVLAAIISAARDRLVVTPHDAIYDIPAYRQMAARGLAPPYETYARGK